MVDSPVRPAPAARNGFAAPSTPAQRTRRARWRDGRLVLGVLLVALTALIGAKLLSSADDTVAVWATKYAVPAGGTLAAGDLTTVRVRFTGDAARAYVETGSSLDGMVAVRPIGAGELVPRAATASRQDSDRTELPLAVATGGLPADLATGDQVDVWVVPKPDRNAKTTPDAVRLWDHLQVLGVDTAKGVAASSSRRQVLLGLDPKQAARLSTALQQLTSGEPVLVRRAG